MGVIAVEGKNCVTSFGLVICAHLTCIICKEWINWVPLSGWLTPKHNTFSLCELAELYVSDREGNDATGDGTKEKPFKTGLKVLSASKQSDFALSNDLCHLECDPPKNFYFRH